MAAVTAPGAGWSTSHRSQPYPSYEHQQYQHHPSAPSSSLATMAYHHPNDAGRAVSMSAAVHGSSPSYRHASGGYDSYPSAREDTAPPQPLEADSYAYAELTLKKRTRTSKYVDDEARQAAKTIQKARRREQNRNAQRRLRDRKEEHIFKLEGEVASLRRQGERDRSEKRDLEEMIRRLMDQRDDMQRRLDALGAASSHSGREEYSTSNSVRSAAAYGRGRVGALTHDNALGLVDDYAGYASTSSRSSSTSDADARESVSSTSTSSASISTPSPSAPLHSPYAKDGANRAQRPSIPFTRMPSVLSNGSSPTQVHLPRIKLEPPQHQQQQFAPLMTTALLPSVGADHWS
ncbi:conserved hypothetical protein [Sporisorium reilianum SRZ2]|uniref:BZIP domain-containing protein n=1 Tax=Sporisorium reilianum (strain SRZ2) TaxID=999809 RepID=E6ZQM0_SPORE|nr:conserved hypothetical protein [Sporisorium reilianum SRZ2]